MRKAFGTSHEQHIYRSELVAKACEKIMLIAAEVNSKKAFEAKSLSFVNKLFDKINIETAEYYDILKYRAWLLETVVWANDKKKGVCT